jgi:AcrR family transcriptional regulator
MAGKPTDRRIDRRIQRTYKILHEALVELILEKGYDKVTVQDVIDRANVGRSTFYSHFKDLEDLFLRGFENLWSQFELHFSVQAPQTMDVWDVSLVVFQHAQNYTGVYKAVVGKQGGRLMSAHMHKYLSVLMRNVLKPHWQAHTLVPLDIVVHHLASSLIASLTWWVDHDLQYPPERMNEIYRLLTQPAIQAIL